MNIPMWLEVSIGALAGIGVGTIVRGIMVVSRYIVRTASDLSTTLKDATEIARAYREDLGALRTIAQTGWGQSRSPEDEPESLIPQQAPNAMPSPYWSRFPVKPKEPDAPAEPAREVDVTATDEELAEQESGEQAADIEAQERQKAATREADAARLRELANQSGEPEDK
jgi:hypothetical protein